MAEYRYRINGHTYNIEIGAENGGTIEVSVNGKVYTVERQEISTTADMAPKSIPVQKTSALDANTAAVTAPLPGTIISIKVKPGDKVTANQTVAVLEAMKMENEILAPADGTVTAVYAKEGTSVNTGDVLFELA